MILGKNPHKNWSDTDRNLLEAYQIVEDEKCSQCGLPTWLCHTENPDIIFTVATDECQATKKVQLANDKAQERISKKKDSKPEFGKQRYPEWKAESEDGKLYKLRDEFYKAQARRQEQMR